MKHVCDVPSDQIFFMNNTSSNESYVVHYVPGKWLLSGPTYTCTINMPKMYSSAQIFTIIATSV